MNMRDWNYVDDILKVSEQYPVADEALQEFQESFAKAAVNFDSIARQTKREAYVKLANCYQRSNQPEQTELCVRRGLKVLDDSDTWMEFSLAQCKKMFDICAKGCEYQILNQAAKRPDQDSPEFEKSMKANLGACASDCLEQWNEQFIIKKGNARDEILEKYKEFRYALRGMDDPLKTTGPMPTEKPNDYFWKNQGSKTSAYSYKQAMFKEQYNKR